ncbi:TorF family putative porin [Acinetobacter sp. TSRC1-2]|uniref:TorF family putative porin n=1 Tax=unclassified Acinetobacter TaxID=196816 RepID=UPI003CFA96D3
MLQNSHKIALSLLLAMSTMPAFAEEQSTLPAVGALTGSFAVVNKYIFRGGVENDDVALQAGVEYAHQSGVSVGYWGSTLGYDPSDDSEDKDHGFEHDFYVAYAQDINPDWSYKVQGTAYYYQDGGTVYAEDGDERKTTAFDVLGKLAYKNLTLSASLMLTDASFANAGDVYLSAAYSYALPQNFMLNTLIGASIYNSSRDDSMIETKNEVAFNEARMGMSKEIANMGATASFDYVVGGKDRFDTDFDDQVVFGLNFNF